MVCVRGPLPAQSSEPLIRRAWYQGSIEEFCRFSSGAVLGQLARNSTFDVDQSQIRAWNEEIEILRHQLAGLPGWIFLEFAIPRMGARADAIVLHEAAVYVLEFKTGESGPTSWAREQVWDYALDLKNFHAGSHHAWVVPVLVAAEAVPASLDGVEHDPDLVFRPICTSPGSLRAVFEAIARRVRGAAIDPVSWARSVYRPTPTIIEAARALYANHSVEDLARSDAGARNLAETSQCLESIIREAREGRKKMICFVTGVPGAGKTLAGLNLAARHPREASPFHSVYLSGNGPLIAVLREALVRDEVRRRRGRGSPVPKTSVLSTVKAFIQNVHHFRDEAVADPGAPAEHVAIFDEAQRAWTAEQTARFMRQRHGIKNWSQSEPDFLLSCLDRHEDWAVVVCLVGGGQEINTGEAGIEAWLEAVGSRFRHWHACISPRLTDSEYAAGRAVAVASAWPNVRLEESLHLAVSMRSFRAENVSTFVKALLDCDRAAAERHWERLRSTYPIVLTRDLKTAKDWVRKQARGSERYGLLASSRALRLKPHAIDVRVSVDPVCWFLNDRDDIRSSYYLEDAATEFQVQGLEVDWACVTWDADLRLGGGGWEHYDFRGTRWCRVASPQRRKYFVNAYRVLLTRARQGMVVFVPPGDRRDPTRLPEFYDATYDYLRRLGLPVLD